MLAMFDSTQYRLLLEHSLLQSLGRMLSHDVNGKVMGVDGILSCWGDEFDPSDVCEDVAVVRESFRDMQAQFQLFYWFFQSEPQTAQALTLDQVKETLKRYLSRFFSPPSSFRLLDGVAGKSIFCTPYQLVFWTSSFCEKLAGIRPGSEPVELRIDACSEGRGLTLRCASPYLESLLAEEADSPLPPEWEQWLELFREDGGICRLRQDGALPIELTIPLSA